MNRVLTERQKEYMQQYNDKNGIISDDKAKQLTGTCIYLFLECKSSEYIKKPAKVLKEIKDANNFPAEYEDLIDWNEINEICRRKTSQEKLLNKYK